MSEVYRRVRDRRRPLLVSGGGPLSDVRILDLAGEPGVFAGRILADLGAQVIRVEPTMPDPVRDRRPFLHDIPGPERSLYHLHFNAGKQSVALDLSGAAGRAAFLKLAAVSDALIETAEPGAMDALGIGYAELHERNPSLIYATITPFGQSGPMSGYRGNALTGAAAAGLMFLNGRPDDPPNQPGSEQAYHMASLVCASGLLIALRGRDQHPQRPGTRVDVSVQEAASMSTLQTANQNYYTWYGRIPARRGIFTFGGKHLFECADGKWISFVVMPYRWREFAAWLSDEGIESEVTSPEWEDPAFRAQHPGGANEAMAALARRHTRAEMFHEGQRRLISVMPVNDVRDIVEDAQLNERGFFQEVVHPELGALKDVGPVPLMNATPLRLQRPAPSLGQHNAEVLGDLLGMSPAEAAALAAPHDRAARPQARAPQISLSAPAVPAVAAGDAPPPRPLEGLRVADFFWLIAGPATSRMLADFGAEVIKVESEEREDQIRNAGTWPPQRGAESPNAVFVDCNTNKLSLTLNLNKPRAIELAKELVRHSDVVTNNFTGERMDRWGLGYKDLVKVKPDIIMITMPVMGATGPYRSYGANGLGVVSYGGINTTMGFEGRPPTGMGPLYSDFTTPYFAVSAVMAAIHHRDRTGEGQFIDLSQAQATVALLGSSILEYTANGRVPGRPGNRSQDFCPHGAYSCWGEDRWIAIAAATDAEWYALCDVVGRPDLRADSRLCDLAGRKAHEDEIDAAISDWTRHHDPWQAMHLLQQAGVTSAVVEDLEDLVLRDPHMPSSHFQALSDPETGVSYLAHAQPLRLGGRLPELRWPPKQGEHNEYVVRELLGLSHDEYVELMVEGVLR